FSVNHKRPSGPATISSGLLFAVGIVYSVMLPDVVALAILLVLYSVNQIRPSGPKVAVIPWGLLLPLSPYSVMLPEVVLLPMPSGGFIIDREAVNHKFPSGPATMSQGLRPLDREYSVKLPAVVTLAILVVAFSVNHI